MVRESESWLVGQRVGVSRFMPVPLSSILVLEKGNECYQVGIMEAGLLLLSLICWLY